MTIYVDEPQTWTPTKANWCHMWSSLVDTDPIAAQLELREMAFKLRLNPRWQRLSVGQSGEFPHFDLSPVKRKLAIIEGAVEIRLTDWIKQRPNYKG